MTVASGLSVVQTKNFADSQVSTTFIVKAQTSDEVNLQVQERLSWVCAYEPPPDIGGPKRTSGSGGRYV